MIMNITIIMCFGISSMQNTPMGRGSDLLTWWTFLKNDVTLSSESNSSRGWLFYPNIAAYSIYQTMPRPVQFFTPLHPSNDLPIFLFILPYGNGNVDAESIGQSSLYSLVKHSHFVCQQRSCTRQLLIPVPGSLEHALAGLVRFPPILGCYNHL